MNPPLIPGSVPPGNWFREETGDALAAHLDAPPPVGPHYDHVAHDGSEWRHFEDGRIEPKARSGATGELEIVDLGAAGQGALRRSLSVGHMLSRLVNGRPETGHGDARAAVPAGTPKDRVARVDEGGLMDQGVAWTRAVAQVGELAGPGRVLVAEHINLLPNSPRVQELPGNRFTVAGGVFDWTDALDDDAAVTACLRRANAPWVLNALVVEVDRPPTTVDADALEAMAAAVRGIVFRVFDGEGLAVWTPRAS